MSREVRVWVEDERRLAVYRVAAGLSRTELAEKAGCSPGTVAKIENGVSWPRRSTQEKLAEALSITAEELFCDEAALWDIVAAATLRE